MRSRPFMEQAPCMEQAKGPLVGTSQIVLPLPERSICRCTIDRSPHSAGLQSGSGRIIICLINLGSKIMDSIAGEVWFLTGSQHLYGPGPLEQVAANSRQVVEGLNSSGRLPLAGGFQAGRDHARLDPGGSAARPTPRPMRGADLLDAHLLARQDVDCRTAGAGEAPCPPAHAVQPRYALGHDRHGFHEPQPGGPRRPRVRPYLHPDAKAAQGGGRALAGGRRARATGRLGAGGRRLGRRSAI